MNFMDMEAESEPEVGSEGFTTTEEERVLSFFCLFF